MTDYPLVTISDLIDGVRSAEPIRFAIDGDLTGDLWLARDTAGKELVCQRLHDAPRDGRTHFITVADMVTHREFRLVEPLCAGHNFDCIRELDPQEPDAFVQLDTGHFGLELCRGTAQGTGASKWGIRHLHTQGGAPDLLRSGNNAIGGFYGPFFTPENGLINPPEHVVATVDVVQRGPLLHHYRLRGTVPDGLLPELRGINFAIDWQFTYHTPWFKRTYFLDDFQTTINGRSITDKITVGDEFEAGTGGSAFTRFQTYGETCFREGDPYAHELKAAVAAAVTADAPATERFTYFKSLLLDDMETAHWDLYWRLFSVWEKALTWSELHQILGNVRAAAHVRADLNDRPWKLSRDALDVPAALDQTIFAGPATKTVEYHPDTGLAMIWSMSQGSGAFQIVQRPQSGWGNWGTNGENECPTLPVGTDIKTAYGMFAENWRQVADQMETPPTVTVIRD